MEKNLNIIKKYLLGKNITEPVVNVIVKKFYNNEDIADELIYYIKNNSYKEEDIIIEGFSAKKLALKHDSLDVIGVYTALIDLRNDPSDELIKKYNNTLVIK